jgi:hypothetical protein
MIICTHPGPTRGRFGRSSRNVGRDAMDADGTLDEARRPRTAKSCGPDLPTLGSSLKSLQATVAKTPGTPGRTRISRKTARAGNAGSFRRTCGDLLACFFHSHARLRVRLTRRHSLLPPSSRDDDDASLGHIVPRERRRSSLRANGSARTRGPMTGSAKQSRLSPRMQFGLRRRCASHDDEETVV